MTRIIGLLYIIALVVCVVCVPLSAILIICKLCAESALSWIGCCVPLIIALAFTPILIITKLLLDAREEK